jgi:hypothetical protein
MAEKYHSESAVGTIIGWGALAIFAIGFGWYVGAPLIMGERWADKQNDAIQLVKDMKPSGASHTLYDMLRDYSLQAKERDLFIGEMSWSAIQRDGPEYEVTLLWTEGQTKRVALWRVNIENKEVRPQGNEAGGLPQRLAAGPKPPE